MTAFTSKRTNHFTCSCEASDGTSVFTAPCCLPLCIELSQLAAFPARPISPIPSFSKAAMTSSNEMLLGSKSRISYLSSHMCFVVPPGMLEACARSKRVGLRNFPDP